MKALVPVSLILVLVLVATSYGQDSPANFKSEYLEKTYGIKFKSLKVQELKKSKNFGAILYVTLEFTKDIDNIEGLRETFKLGKIEDGGKGAKIKFLFFDQESVCTQQAVPMGIQGDFSGKAGDAFRVMVGVSNTATVTKAHKIEARPVEEPKKESPK